MLIILTVVRKDGVHNEFWGQGIIAGPDVLDRKTKVRLNLGDMKVSLKGLYSYMSLFFLLSLKMALVLLPKADHVSSCCWVMAFNVLVVVFFQFEPRDKKNTVPLRSRVLDDVPITGQISVEISPCFNFNSKCSIIHETPDLGKDDARNVLRSWWACLVESSLLLFKKFGDTTPYRSMTVLRVTWYTPSIIRVSSVRSDESILFTCPNPDRTDWFNKLRAAAIG